MKKTKLLLLTALLAGASFGCNQSSLLSPNGSESGEQGSLQVLLSHAAVDAASLVDLGGAKELTNDLGLVIHLNHAELGLKNLNLISSGDDPECVGGSDTLLALNGSEDLLGLDDVETSIGSFEIPITAYCSYELTLGGTASAAALKFHDTGHDHDEDLDGEGSGSTSTPAHAALHLKGNWMKGHDEVGGLSTAHADFDEGDPINTVQLSLSAPAAHVIMADFDVEISEDVLVTAKFRAAEDGSPIDHPLHFHGTDTARDVSFGVHYDLLFQGVDFSSQTDVEVRAKIIENLKSAVFQKL